ncbi:hypothetical protein PFISCL1PPCAC_4619, partial [Pristionchus fissidentatus]
LGARFGWFSTLPVDSAPSRNSAHSKLRPLDHIHSEMFFILLIAAVIAAAAYYHFQTQQAAGSKKKSNDVPTSCVSTANQPGTVTVAAGSTIPQSVTAVAKTTDSDAPQKPGLTESMVNRIEALPATTPAVSAPSAASPNQEAAKPAESATSNSAISGPATPSIGTTPNKSKKKKRTRRRKKSGASASKD